MTLLERLPTLQTDLVDAKFLKAHLQDYARPNDKLSEWLKNGELLALKNGLYLVKDPRNLLPPSSRETIANRLFGPSYVSLQSALSHYGLIPERVENTTSVTPLRNKRFHTPVGEFTYRHQPLKIYQVGSTLTHEGFLIATPEKALLDLIALEKPAGADQPEHLESFLYDDLRIERKAIAHLNRKQVTLLSATFRSPAVRAFERYLQWLK